MYRSVFNLFGTFFLVLLVFSALGICQDQDIDQTLREINKAIRSAGAEWTAGITGVAALRSEEQKMLCGDPEDPVPDWLKEEPPAPDGVLPTHFDWRNNGGDWTTPIRDQGGCGSCWDFAATAVFEALLNINAENPGLDMDLSEQYVLSCCDNCGSCNGGYSDRALEFYCATGGVTESCMPYQADDSVSCSEACTEPDVYFLYDWLYIVPDIEAIKSAIYYYGPISAAFEVYEDFFSYTGGIYEHVWGDYLGGHAISIVGWDDVDQYWICKNSWGTDWGEGGWFKIRWGECAIEERRSVLVTIDEWIRANVNVTVIDEAGQGLEGVDIYANDEFYGTTGCDGTLALNLIADMYYEIVAFSSDDHLLLYGNVIAPDSLVLDCSTASYVTVTARKLDGSALDAWLVFEIGSSRQYYYVAHTPSGAGWFYISPDYHDFHVWSYSPEVERYDLVFRDADLTTSGPLMVDASTIPTARWTLDELAGSYDYLRLFGWPTGFRWALLWGLDSGDSLVLSADNWSYYRELVDSSVSPYTWYYEGWFGVLSLAGGEEFHISAGGDLTLLTWAEKAYYLQGEIAKVWIELRDAYGNTYGSVDRYDDSEALQLPDLARSAEESASLPRSGGPDGSWAYYDPWLTVTPPTKPQIFDQWTWLEYWQSIELDPEAELGTYEVRATQQTHLGELGALSSFEVLGPSSAVFRITDEGVVLADGPVSANAFLSGSADMAEWVSVSEPVEPSDVLELDPDRPGHYRKSRGPCSTLVAGVVSTDPGFVLGGSATDDSLPTTHAQALLALVGIVPVKVTDEGGPIEPGDLLVSALTPGYAMRWDPDSGEACGVIGKALEGFESGEGLIKVLLMS